MLARRAYVTFGDSCHVVRCADDVTYLAAASLLAVASLLYLTRKSQGAGPFETQAGSRVEGTRGPSGAPRSGGGGGGKRACPSTGMCELRSGPPTPSTAGDPVCTTHTGRGRGVVFSWLLLFDHSKRSDSAAGRNASALALEATSNKQQATSNKQQATSNKQQATSNKRRSLAAPPPATAKRPVRINRQTASSQLRRAAHRVLTTRCGISAPPPHRPRRPSSSWCP